MKNNKQNHRVLTLLIALMCTWVLSGCGGDPNIDVYKQNMEVYFQGLVTLDERINAIDPSQDADGTKLLGYLDQLENITVQMAELEVPEQFSLVEGLADEASENMTQAVALYHNIYETDEYNQSMADGAYEYYTRANKRISYIHSILQGDIPEELQITDSGDADNSDSQTDYQQNSDAQYNGAESQTESEEEYVNYEYVEDEDDALQYLDVED